MKATILRTFGVASTLAIILAVSVAGLAFASAANAQMMSGSDAVNALGNGSFATSSLTLAATNFFTAAGIGTFATVPEFSYLTASTTTITGLSTSPLADSIPDLFVFSTPGILGSSGTTPNNRFDFNLLTITETSSSLGDFTGTGTLVDTTAAYAPTPAIFTLGFSGANNYSFTIAAEPVPEPTTIGLVAIGLLGALTIRRRKV
jgi:hypothetical protein